MIRNEAIGRNRTKEEEIMIFKVDEVLKKEINEVVVVKRTSVKVMRVIEVINLIIGAVVLPIGALLAYLIPGVFMETGPYDVIRKSMDTIFITFVLPMCAPLLISLFVYVLRKVFTASLIGNRTNEVLEIQDDMLIYSYRIKHNQSPMGQGIITMNIDNIDFVTYTEKSKQIVIDGLMSSQSVDFTSTNEEVSLVEPEPYAFGLFDYFQPSLVEELASRGVHINYE